jgi:hypothetical protein
MGGGGGGIRTSLPITGKSAITDVNVRTIPSSSSSVCLTKVRVIALLGQGYGLCSMGYRLWAMGHGIWARAADDSYCLRVRCATVNSTDGWTATRAVPTAADLAA